MKVGAGRRCYKNLASCNEWLLIYPGVEPWDALDVLLMSSVVFAGRLSIQDDFFVDRVIVLRFIKDKLFCRSCTLHYIVMVMLYGIGELGSIYFSYKKDQKSWHNIINSIPYKVSTHFEKNLFKLRISLVDSSTILFMCLENRNSRSKLILNKSQII